MALHVLLLNNNYEEKNYKSLPTPAFSFTYYGHNLELSHFMSVATSGKFFVEFTLNNFFSPVWPTASANFPRVSIFYGYE